MNHPHPDRPQPFWRSRTGLAFLGLFAIAAFFLFTEHRAHALGALPFLGGCSVVHGLSSGRCRRSSKCQI